VRAHRLSVLDGQQPCGSAVVASDPSSLRTTLAGFFSHVRTALTNPRQHHRATAAAYASVMAATNKSTTATNKSTTATDIFTEEPVGGKCDGVPTLVTTSKQVDIAVAYMSAADLCSRSSENVGETHTVKQEAETEVGCQWVEIEPGCSVRSMAPACSTSRGTHDAPLHVAGLGAAGTEEKFKDAPAASSALASISAVYLPATADDFRLNAQADADYRRALGDNAAASSMSQHAVKLQWAATLGL
jgi:hypothetical protein